MELILLLYILRKGLFVILEVVINEVLFAEGLSLDFLLVFEDLVD